MPTCRRGFCTLEGTDRRVVSLQKRCHDDDTTSGHYMREQVIVTGGFIGHTFGVRLGIQATERERRLKGIGTDTYPPGPEKEVLAWEQATR